jgi:aerobic-type carbon monoxide dehydrogenase small subunit (CoxS/CutS family)
VTESTKKKAQISFTLNGEAAEVAFAPHKTLLEVLREDLALTGTKHGCELGECGTCTVLVNGRSILSCLFLGLDAEGREVTTIEGMAEGGVLHPLQDTFADTGAAQCGYCSPGFLLAAKRCQGICAAAPAISRFTKRLSWLRRGCVVKSMSFRVKAFTDTNRSRHG